MNEEVGKPSQISAQHCIKEQYCENDGFKLDKVQKAGIQRQW